VYSVTSTRSFDAIPHYIEEISRTKKNKFPVVLVATQGKFSTTPCDSYGDYIGGCIGDQCQPCSRRSADRLLQG
jgi:hypothetical protein